MLFGFPFVPIKRLKLPMGRSDAPKLNVDFPRRMARFMEWSSLIVLQRLCTTKIGFIVQNRLIAAFLLPTESELVNEFVLSFKNARY